MKLKARTFSKEKDGTWDKKHPNSALKLAQSDAEAHLCRPAQLPTMLVWFLGFSQPFGWFGFLDVLWLQHSWDCFPLVAACWGSSWPLLSVAFWACAGLPAWNHLGCGSEADPVFGSYLEGSSIPLAHSCFLDFISLNFDEESMILKHGLLGAPQGDTNQFIVFSMWLALLWMCDLFSRESIHNKHNVFSSLASICFKHNRDREYLVLF